jgi:hypothetical protein
MRVRPAELVLYDDTRSVILRPINPNAGDEVICTSWDLGAADVRVTNTPRAGVDGTDDGPGLLGARTVTFDLVFIGQDPYTKIDLLSAMSHPAARPVLRVTRLGGQPWTMALRGIPFAIAYGPQQAGKIEASITFNCPAGYLQGPLLGPYSTHAASSTGRTDWRFPAHFRKGFGAGVNPYAGVSIDVGGNIPISPVIYIFGPVTNPVVFTDEGERFAFEGLTLATGQGVQIDMEAGTVRRAANSLIANANADVWAHVDFDTSTFWTWAPGIHTVRYAASTGTVSVQYRERRLNI